MPEQFSPEQIGILRVAIVGIYLCVASYYAFRRKRYNIFEKNFRQRHKGKSPIFPFYILNMVMISSSCMLFNLFILSPSSTESEIYSAHQSNVFSLLITYKSCVCLYALRRFHKEQKEKAKEETGDTKKKKQKK